MIKVIIIIGTRPEAIKTCLLYQKMKQDPRFSPVMIHTGQHDEMVQPIFSLFGVVPDDTFRLMDHNQNLSQGLAYILPLLHQSLTKHQPDIVLVQGDTLSCYAGAMAAFHLKIPIGHIEAGLRTYDKLSPYPEEMYRRLVDQLADYHFAPTMLAKENLTQEFKDSKQIRVVGNTGIDALLHVSNHLDQQKLDIDISLKSDIENIKKIANNKLIILTLHRREMSEDALILVLKTLAKAAKKLSAKIIFPVHLSPRIKETVHQTIGKNDSFILIQPLDYQNFIFLMKNADLIVTDSGGIQEEAPYLEKRVIVVREKTERSELPDHQNKIVGFDQKELQLAISNAILNPPVFDFEKPYGEGNASEIIIEILHHNFKGK